MKMDDGYLQSLWRFGHNKDALPFVFDISNILNVKYLSLKNGNDLEPVSRSCL